MDATFQIDLDILQDPLVPSTEKEWMLDVILSQIVPYRFHQEPRLFPELSFYGILLNNREDFMKIWAFVTRFHSWIYGLASSSPAMADEAIESLRQMKRDLGIDLGLGIGGDLAVDNNLGLGIDFGALAPIDLPLPEYPSPPGTSVETSVPTTPQPKPQTYRTRAPKETTSRVPDHPLLAAELQKPATPAYEGVIRDLSHFQELDEAYNRHVKRPPGTAPEQDPSWPSTTEKRVEYVREMYLAIVKTDDFFELRKARERMSKAMAKVSNGAAQQEMGSSDNDSRKRKTTATNGNASERPKGLSKADWELLSETNSSMDRLNAVIHHKIVNVELEIACWRLLLAAEDAQLGFTMKPMWSGHRTVSTWDQFNTFGERWSAMCGELLDCKILVHSLLRADWFSKFASAPNKERAAKLSNDLLNGRRDVQNQVGRDVIRERTANEEWQASEDFEIRTREGSLVHQGNQIGDRTRRQLAKRQKV
ncbi:hypothetical protein K4K49_012607 [Colletotrichum sp. SAR 10_70]|nr:hypothetical protein K4K50_009718 [Colletotrichum sp. SAR 10_71]KAI8176130.1 hypothetical protein K4K51_006811 [Colletotrichum sp. SAR 10_75]KAI8189071.1 hypothetical protein K4K49_012607 [Colletotrichum sp. SAR 10_70]KAI8225922.1 hypothetical protein K4K53_006324 [Colletotrichum sp. SAR 10_77]